MTRLERLAAGLVEPLLVTNLTNVRYLTGLQSSNACLLVEPGGHTRLFTDSRYLEAARAVEGVELVASRRAMLKDVAEIVRGRVGFEADHLSYAQWELLEGPGAELVPRRGVVEALRAVKDDEELDAIWRAAQVVDEVYRRIADEGVLGRTEREVAWRILSLFHEFGAEAAAFDVIVAAGPNSSRPHARVGEREIRAGETVVIDIGCRIEGYCSDCTRTIATGPLPEALEAAYAVVLEAQLAGLAAVRAGVRGIDADAAARRVIAEAGLGELFGHGLGHGVGLDIHEAPTLSRESDDTLASGNVVTVEPGIYIPGLGGIRIEDLVVIGVDSNDVLTRFPKDLLVIQ
jgi:Xaa-Pro aminopeptidase